jgi:hypothetical protein
MARQTKARVIINRVLQALPVLAGIVIVTFALTRALPGDPAVYFAGPSADARSIAEVRKSLGLDRSMPEQLLLYVGQLSRGDLGQSISTGQPVSEEILRRLPASLELTLAALLLSIVVAVPLGILAATRPDTWIDHLCRPPSSPASDWSMFSIICSDWRLRPWAGSTSWFFHLHASPASTPSMRSSMAHLPPREQHFHNSHFQR